MLTIYTVSDASGETAERMVHSALAQFTADEVTVTRRGGILTRGQVVEVIEEATGHNSLVLHTLVSHELRDFMLAESRRRSVDAMDLMGPMLDRLAAHLRLTPKEEPGLFDQLVRARSREIEAVEFAFRHDDGLCAEELWRAEVVLVGASRTMKTPTSLFLAYQGWFAGNVPLIPEIPVHSALRALPAERVFCLIMSPARLRQLRRARANHLPMAAETYAAPETIRREILHSRNVSAEFNWRQIDVTGKSVEEVAREIVALLPEDSRAQRATW
jgi:regulator of PEP synthase PpsR (kinase-PPPase family)